MALFTVNSNNVLGKGVAESGVYNVEVADTSVLVTTKGRGHEMITLDYTVMDGEYTGGKVRFDNVVWNPDNLVFSEKKVNTILVAVGVQDGTPVNSMADVLKGLIGKKLSIRVEWEKSDFNGKWNLVVKGYDQVVVEGSKPDGKKRPDAGNTTQQKANNMADIDPFATSGQQVNNARSTNDPFATTGGQIDISDDDIPF